MNIHKFFGFVSLLFCLVITSLASARPARVALWAHGNTPLKEESIISLRSDMAIASLESSRPTTYIYFGLGFDLSKHVRVDTFAGYDTLNEYIASPRLITTWDKFSTWTLVEYYSKNKGGYIFQMADYAPTKWLQAGAEYEWFGSYKTIDQSSHGFGPHLLFNLGRYSLDTVLQARQYTAGSNWEVVPFFRVHFFL